MNTDFASETHISDEEILVKFGLLSPQEMVSMATLRTCAMLAQWADTDYLEPFTDEVSMHEKTWMTQAVKEINKMAAKVTTGWSHLESFKSVIDLLRSSKAQHNMNNFIKKYSKALIHERGQRWLISRRFPQKGIDGQKIMKEGEALACDKCGQSFKSPSALGVHRFKAHGFLCEAYSYAASSTCYACQGMYHSRERLVQHIQWGTMGCLERLRHLVEPLTREQIIYLNEKDKVMYKEYKKQGRRHENQTKTFCREDVMDINELVGDWNDFFDRQKMSVQEQEELAEIEAWVIDGPLLGLFEGLPHPQKLSEVLTLFESKCSALKSAKVCLVWADMMQKDLWVAYEGTAERNDCMKAWAMTRSFVLSKFF